MPKAVSPDHPNLQEAVGRLRRIQYTWAALFFGMALLTVLGEVNAIPVHWLAGAILLVLGPQPALLGMVAVIWGLSLLGLVPDLNASLAIDPVGALFGVELIEALALGFVRLVMLLMAWSQLLFYRMLYGVPSPGAGLPEIPPVVENRTGWLSSWARVAVALSGLLALVQLTGGGTLEAASAGIGLASLAVGLGLGVAFSPTRQRPAALASVVLGGMLFIFTVALSSQ